jgi:Fe-S oxidoreductase
MLVTAKQRKGMIAQVSQTARTFAGWKAPFINAFHQTWVFRRLFDIVLGLDSRRTMPKFAAVSLHKWFAQRADENDRPGKEVVLFDDTYMNYHQVNIGISAVHLLESCGYKVTLARAGCCQRVKISHGFHEAARVEGEKTLRNLSNYVQQGLKVVVCEPSCHSALTQDLPKLIDDEELRGEMRENVMMIDKFLAEEIESGNLDCTFTSPFARILIKGHCHLESSDKEPAMKRILEQTAGVSVSMARAGCCGMRGSFGYEKENYDASMRIGERNIFPAVRDFEHKGAVVACGFSCREQIAHGTGVEPLHWVQTLRGNIAG